MTTTYAIIGAGIAGASVAYHLARRTDDRVVVFDQGDVASATTARSVAQFGFYGDETQYRMKRYGMDLYNEFFADPRADPRYELAGLLTVATTADGASELEAAVASGGDEDLGKVPGTGIDRDLVEYVPGDELTESLLVPPLDESVVEGALYRPKMGYMTRPAALAREFVARAREAGAEFRLDTPVRDVETDDGRVTAVVADERLAVEELVCAAGPWNVELARTVGVDLPVRHTLAPVLELEPESPLEYSLPAVSHYEGPHAIHRRRADAVLVGHIPPDGYGRDQRFDPDDVGDEVPATLRDGMVDAVERFTPRFAGAPVVDEWVGVRSQTPDGNPVVGWTGVEGFSVAAFHTSGIQLSPAVGRVVTDQLLGDDPTGLYDALSITRFDGYSDHRT
ncbi:MAG: FAD-binding oxidoreductase [Haloarculaceae archaeon]